MLTPLFCQWHNESPEDRKNRHQRAIARLELRKNRVIPVFDEATQISARTLNAPICILGILDGEEYCFKSGFGVANFGFNSELIRSRKINKEDSFATYVIDSKKPLKIENTIKDPFFFQNILVQHHQIKAYLGVPLITAQGDCIGCLEVFDLESRPFTPEQIEYIYLTARWCMAEYERDYLINQAPLLNQNNEHNQSAPPSPDNKPNQPNTYSLNLKIKLVNQLIQKISLPLTSVIGMSSVLKQGIYGKINDKQLEYLNIVYDSGQEITALLDEIISLGIIHKNDNLELSLVDIEIIGEQISQSLQMSAKNKQCTLRLSFEPGDKLWYLDREKVQQTIYYLVTTIIETARPGGNIQIHFSHQSSQIKINILIKHPWLGDGIPYEKTEVYLQAIEEYYDVDHNDTYQEELENYSYDIITLLFSCYLAKLQQGNIQIKGTPELGYRFEVNIPTTPHYFEARR
ncbi:GAF domain-containing protein [Cyanobacterium stanieri LEGE 03274]|uniref:GAF domain-containing protein n=1 Tax=Cyanobacterium stanieri LEGE 03274 TaxID=1828756 RepID=A0ABR9V2C9_9CHRO|nr:GAF domain-containing protein [Cyanobacterium stanieri]MBE9222007.1 GAF domain-containing protein [Cyanobacterium stanieri LEGE 03274]